MIINETENPTAAARLTQLTQGITEEVIAEAGKHCRSQENVRRIDEVKKVKITGSI